MLPNTVTASLAGVLGLSSPSLAHMIMKTPAPFGTPDNSPLSSSGSDYPCKLTGDPDKFYSSTKATSMAIGQDQTLSFSGSAVHGGGSCQLAITSDSKPSASTTWQVIQSMEGGCPTKDGNGPSEYTFQIPDGVAAGKYVFAWTWISKLAGQPEYYMNCAPIEVTGASSNGSSMASDLTTRDTPLPNLFVANLNSINSCKTSPGTDPTYPSPGHVLVRYNKVNAKYANVAGTDCFPKGAVGAAAAAPASPVSAGSAAPSSPASTTLVTSVLPATTATATASASAFAFAPAPAPATVAVIPSAPAAPSAPASVPGGSTSTSSSTGSLSGACTSEGMFNCIGGDQYQQCASGAWTALGAMPAGTKCTLGQTMTLWARDSHVLSPGRRFSAMA